MKTKLLWKSKSQRKFSSFFSCFNKSSLENLQLSQIPLNFYRTFNALKLQLKVSFAFTISTLHQTAKLNIAIPHNVRPNNLSIRASVFAAKKPKNPKKKVEKKKNLSTENCIQ